MSHSKNSNCVGALYPYPMKRLEKFKRLTSKVARTYLLLIPVCVGYKAACQEVTTSELLCAPTLVFMQSLIVGTVRPSNGTILISPARIVNQGFDRCALNNATNLTRYNPAVRFQFSDEDFPASHQVWPEVWNVTSGAGIPDWINPRMYSVVLTHQTNSTSFDWPWEVHTPTCSHKTVILHRNLNGSMSNRFNITLTDSGPWKIQGPQFYHE